jgi:DNA-binding GntR family transcriptional regulator
MGKTMQTNQGASTQRAERSSVPLYLQIQATLKQRIMSGRYGVACALPTEAELCAEFKASRFTIREALRGLTEQGFLQRRPRSGTIVLTREPRGTYTQSVSSIEDLFQIATQTHYVLLSTTKVTIDKATAAQIGGERGEPWIRVDGTRWDKPGGRAICYIQSFVPVRYAAIVAEFPDTKGPFYALLEQRSGEAIEEVTQDISALVMPDPMVKALGLAPQSLSLRLLRRYATRTGTLIASFNWHRADEFTYRMQLHRRADATARMPNKRPR